MENFNCLLPKSASFAVRDSHCEMLSFQDGTYSSVSPAWHSGISNSCNVDVSGLSTCEKCANYLDSNGKLSCPLCKAKCSLTPVKKEKKGAFIQTTAQDIQIRRQGENLVTTDGNLVNVVWGRSEPHFWGYATKWRTLKHPGVVQLVGIWKPNRMPTRFCLVLETNIKTDLRTWIKSGDFAAKWKASLLSLFKSISSALLYLHQQNIVHCGVTLSNIMVCRNGNNEEHEFKLTNFSGHWELRDQRDIRVSEVAGNPQYMAPEMFKFKLSKAVDMYSFGVLLYEASHAREMWLHTDPSTVVRNNMKEKQPDFASHIGESLRSLICNCRKRRPKQRPTVQDVIDHNLATSLEVEVDGDATYPSCLLGPEILDTLYAEDRASPKQGTL